MQNLTQLTAKVLEFSSHPAFKRSYCTAKWAKDIARDILRFYAYLKDVLKNCERVTVAIDENNAMFVKYSNGGGKIMIDVIYEALFLPEIELLLKQYRKKIKRVEPLRQAA
jgi:hypothetical protein